MFKKLKYWLWDAEFIEPSETRWRPIANLYVVLFALIFGGSVVLFMNHAASLGPGLGEDNALPAWSQLLQRLQAYGEASGSPLPLVAVLGLAVFAVGFRISLIMRGYFSYQASEGVKFPLRLMGTIGLVNLFNILAIQLVLLSLGGLSLLMLGDFDIGWQSVERLAVLAHGLVMRVPTVVELPYLLTFFVVYMLQGFFHYWLHRVGHTFRAGWLLFHRQHHLSPTLIYPTTSEVFYAIPLFLLAVIPYNLVFAACSKLFSPEPLYVEFIVLNIVFYISEGYGHNTALYHEGRRNLLTRTLGWIFLNGPYHYLHHSSEPVDAGKNSDNNLINLGGGLFGFWDWLFGSYRPLREQRPPVGLTGNPELYMSPLRLACGGMVQLAYELWHNKGLLTRMRIVFGSAAWNPPISHDFAIHPAKQQAEQGCERAAEEPAVSTAGLPL